MTACSSKFGSLYNWGKMWDLHYHPSKCQIISVTRKRNVVKFDYCMNNTVLCRTDSINAAVNGKLELTLLKGRQRFDTVSTSNLKV